MFGSVYAGFGLSFLLTARYVYFVLAVAVHLPFTAVNMKVCCDGYRTKESRKTLYNMQIYKTIAEALSNVIVIALLMSDNRFPGIAF